MPSQRNSNSPNWSPERYRPCIVLEVWMPRAASPSVCGVATPGDD